MRNRRMTIWVMVVIVFVSGQAMGWTQYNDGGTHDISTTINDDVWVDYQTPGMGTTVNLINNGVIPWGYDLNVFENGIINIDGGSSSFLNTYNNSVVTMTSGIVTDWMYSWDSSQISIYGGLIGYDVFTYNNSQISIYGGSIGNRLDSWDNSKMTIYGGSIGNDFSSWHSSQMTIYGGSIGGDLISDGEAIVTIYGSDFAVDGTPVGYAELVSLFSSSYGNEPGRHLTGMLANGEMIDNNFYIGYDARIVLQEVPEPSSLVLFGLGWLICRKK